MKGVIGRTSRRTPRISGRLQRSLGGPSEESLKNDDVCAYNKQIGMIFMEELPSLFEYHKNTKNLNLQSLTIWVTQ